MTNLANNTIWPDVEARLVELIEAHNSTIVFANSRRLAERLTARLNEIHAERYGLELPESANRQVAGVHRPSCWAVAKRTVRQPFWRAPTTVRSAKNNVLPSKTTSKPAGSKPSWRHRASSWASIWARSIW